MTLEELVRASDASRLRLAESHAHLRRALDVPNRLRHSLMEKPSKWLGVSLVAGFAGGFLFRKKKAPAKVKEPERRRGFMLGLLTLAFTMGKPLAKAYAARMLRDHLAARLHSGKQTRFPSGGKPPY